MFLFSQASELQDHTLPPTNLKKKRNVLSTELEFVDRHVPFFYGDFIGFGTYYFA